MEIASINSVLREEGFHEMVVQSFDARGRKLVVSFMSDGGPREDEAFVVEFEQAILFHLPSVLYASAFFRVAHEPERERLIPPVSYDALEVSGKPGAYTVLVLEDADGVSYGYYLAADSVSASWRKRRELRYGQGASGAW